MRLGGKLVDNPSDPIEWAKSLIDKGYTAGVCPLNAGASDQQIQLLHKTVKKHDLLIAEVGVWNSPLDRDPVIRQQSIDYCKAQLDLADRVGANCCVNISGSRGPVRNGPDKENFSDDTFEMVVDTVREIIDAVKPTHTFYVLECMPFMIPDSIESYQRLLKAIDRKAFGVHFDPVNMLITPRDYYDNGKMINAFLATFGDRIKSCHAKDIQIQSGFPIRIQEVQAGLGVLDYRTYIKAINKIDPNMPLIIEHLQSEEEYQQAAEYITQIAREVS